VTILGTWWSDLLYPATNHPLSDISQTRYVRLELAGSGAPIPWSRPYRQHWNDASEIPNKGYPSKTPGWKLPV